MAILFYAQPSFETWNDSFTGTNGMSADYNKWNSMQSWNRNDPFILDDSLYFDGDSNDSWLGSSYYLSGNFDIQIDWSVENLPTDRNWRIAFGAWEEDLTGNESYDSFYVTRERHTTNLSECDDNMGYTLSINTDAVTTYYKACNNTDTSGKLRIVRIDNTASAYYDNGSGWQPISSQTCHTSPGRIWIGGSGWGTGTQPDISITNFKINAAGDVITGTSEFFSGAQPAKFGTAFNGANNSAPNPTYWTLVSGGSGEGYINNDKLRMTVAGTGDTLYAYYSTYFEDDFDVVVDWEEFGANANYWVSGVIAYESDGEGSWEDDWVTISRLYTSFDQYRSDTNIGGSHNVGTPTSTSDTSGKFRVTRYGDAVRVYYWNNSTNNWDQTADENSLTTSSGIKIVSRLLSGSTGTSHTLDWDNFHVVHDQTAPTGWVTNYSAVNDTMRYVDHNRFMSQPVESTSGWIYHPYWLTGDVDVRVSIRNAWSESSTDTDYGWIMQLWDDNPGNQYFEIGRWRLSGSNVIRTRYEIGAGVVEDTVAIPGSIRLRLTKVGSTWTMYYYDYDNRTWINMTQVTGDTRDLTLWLGTYASPSASQTAGEFYYYTLDGTNGSSYTYS